MKTNTLGIIALVIGLASSPLSGQIQLSKSVISAGAVDASGSGVRLQGTVGQTFTGVATDLDAEAKLGFWYQVVSISTAVHELPGNPGEAESILGVIYPNPCDLEARVPVNLRNAAQITAYLLDSRGQKVALVHDGWLSSGRYELVFETFILPQGRYTLVMDSSGVLTSRPLVVQH